MPAYQLQIKQVVDYPRCRIYRQFIRHLMEDRSIRVSGGSGLFCGTFDHHSLQVISLIGRLPGRSISPRAGTAPDPLRPCRFVSQSASHCV